MSRAGRYGRYPRTEAFRVMSLAEVARELGLSLADTKRTLRRFESYLPVHPRIRTGTREILYNAAAIEAVKAVLGLPHRVLSGGEDWLTRYEGAKR